MIKKEQGVLTYMSQGTNGMRRDDVVGGIHFAQDTDEKIERALAKEKDIDMER